MKVVNNAGKVIEVTKVAWDLLYSKREGFEKYDKSKHDKPKTTKATTKKTATKKKATSSTKKKVSSKNGITKS